MDWFDFYLIYVCCDAAVIVFVFFEWFGGYCEVDLFCVL